MLILKRRENLLLNSRTLQLCMQWYDLRCCFICLLVWRHFVFDLKKKNSNYPREKRKKPIGTFSHIREYFLIPHCKSILEDNGIQSMEVEGDAFNSVYFSRTESGLMQAIIRVRAVPPVNSFKLKMNSVRLPSELLSNFVSGDSR